MLPPLQYSWASLVAQMVEKLLAMQETWVPSLHLGRSPGGEHGNPLQDSCLWIEEPGRLQSLGSQRVGHDSVTKHSTQNNRKF